MLYYRKLKENKMNQEMVSKFSARDDIENDIERLKRKFINFKNEENSKNFLIKPIINNNKIYYNSNRSNNHNNLEIIQENSNRDVITSDFKSVKIGNTNNKYDSKCNSNYDENCESNSKTRTGNYKPNYRQNNNSGTNKLKNKSIFTTKTYLNYKEAFFNDNQKQEIAVYNSKHKITNNYNNNNNNDYSKKHISSITYELNNIELINNNSKNNNINNNSSGIQSNANLNSNNNNYLDQSSIITNNKNIFQNGEPIIPLAPRHIFFNNPNYNLSQRMINDEHVKVPKVQNKKEDEIKFITDIKEEEKHREFLSAKKFLSIPDKACFTIIHMLLDQYTETAKAHNIIASKFQLTLINLLNNSIEQFKHSYKDVLEIQEYYFKAGVFTKNKISRNLPILDLVIRSKIVDNIGFLGKTKTNKNIGFSLAYKISKNKNSKYNKKLNLNINKNNLFNISNNVLIEDALLTWKFDIRSKSQLSTWFASEAEEYKQTVNRFCYSQPIKSFIVNDIIEININILSTNGAILPESLLWLNLIIAEIDDYCFLDFHKGIKKNLVDFDYSRFCELENYVHIWKNSSNLSNVSNTYKSITAFLRYFKDCFDINDVYYDCLKFYIFKIEMTAIKKGFIKKNKYSNNCIEVIDKNESISNEIQCIGLLNIGHIQKRVQARIGDVIWFYIIDI